MTNFREQFRLCACCPAPCRSAVPLGTDMPETETPSGLSLIALAVIDGWIPFDTATRTALHRTEVASQCASACHYGHDMAAAIRKFVAQIDTQLLAENLSGEHAICNSNR